MKAKIVRIQRVTDKGQITLPVAWRNLTRTDAVIVETKGDAIKITPVRLEKQQSHEYTVFDALQHNQGKGLTANSLLKLLEKIDRK